MDIKNIINTDVRPFINQDKPATPEQVFSTNFYHFMNGTPELAKKVDKEILEAVLVANDIMIPDLNGFDLSSHSRRGVLNTSDCGTGKTRGVLDFLCDLKMAEKLPPVLVFAPLSILEPAWAEDCKTWTPNLTVEACYAAKRKKHLEAEVDIHVINHDATKWFMEHSNNDMYEKFKGCILVIDEFTAYKNIDSQRTKATLILARNASLVIELSGTPNPKSVLDLFSPALIADGGAALGRSFYAFRNKYTVPEQTGPRPEMRKWIQKEGALEEVSKKLRPITIRFPAKDVPLNVKRTVKVKLPPKALKAYEDMVNSDFMMNEDGTPISAIHAAARATKLLQLCTGAVYNEEGEIVKFHSERYELVATLVREVEHSLVAFNWRHERVELERLFKKAGITYAVIDGTVKAKDRPQIVADYQNGLYDTLLCHPQSAGHGLTLVKGTRTIWSSLNPNAEFFKQFNHRIDRKGQTVETETICICAEGTREEDVFESLQSKYNDIVTLLQVFAESTKKMQIS